MGRAWTVVVTWDWTLAWVVRASWGYRDRFKGEGEPATSWSLEMAVVSVTAKAGSPSPLT